MLHAVIMAGGSGTRFWPASRKRQPKQLLTLVGDQSMIQATVSRLGALVDSNRVWVITNQQLVDPIAEQLPDVPRAAIVGEPCKRDTAPCVGLAAGLLLANDPDATMLVMPADHVITPDEKFQAAVEQGQRYLEQHPDAIVTFGIRPTYPAATFGYIERDVELPAEAGDAPQMTVKRFREKPSVETAREFLAAGGFYWNSGIFIWRAATIMRALERHEPQMHARLATIADSAGSAEFDSVLQREFTAIDGKSIDYAVMERHQEVVVIEAPFEWDDVGNWQSLARMRGTDSDGNTLIGRQIAKKTRQSIVRSDEQHLVVTLGVENLIVVHTPDATLVANKDDEESVREIVKLLEEKGWSDYL